MDERWVVDALLGVYVGLLVGATSALAGLASTAVDPPLRIAVATGIGVGAVVMGAAQRVDDLVDRVASVPLAVGIVGLPLLFLPYQIVVAEPGSVRGIISVVGLLAILPGIGIPSGGAIIRNRRRRAQSTEIVAVTVGEDEETEEDTNWSVVGATLMIGSALVAGGLFVFSSDGNIGSLLSALGGLASSIALIRNDNSTIAVTDNGLRINRTFTEWDGIDGYRLTDDEIQIVRPGWYHITRNFDREEITDEDSLIEGLEELLPRLDRHGRVELSPRRTRR